jgi:hypothetical protein
MRATGSLTGIAAPLLAAAALATTGVILQAPEKLWAPGLSVFLLLAAAAALVFAVQCGFWARNYAITPTEIAEWWPTMPGDQRWRRVRYAQRFAMRRYRMWADRARLSYAIGIVSLWCGFAVAVLPREDAYLSLVRCAAAALAAGVAAAEAGLTLLTYAQDETPLRRWSDRLTFGLIGRARRVMVGPDPEPLPEETWPFDPRRDPYGPPP